MSIKDADRVRLTLPNGKKIFYHIEWTGVARLNDDKMIMIRVKENEPYKTLEQDPFKE